MVIALSKKSLRGCIIHFVSFTKGGNVRENNEGARVIKTYRLRNIKILPSKGADPGAHPAGLLLL